MRLRYVLCKGGRMALFIVKVADPWPRNCMFVDNFVFESSEIFLTKMDFLYNTCLN